MLLAVTIWTDAADSNRENMVRVSNEDVPHHVFGA